jgi:type I restriction enzyme R subunit
VLAPKGDLEYIHYFCGNTEVPTDLSEREPLRAALYKATVGLLRAFANIADELDQAGYAAGEQSSIKDRMNHYLNVREIVRKASGETLDLKAYEADMRHLIDTYIEADEPRKISPFENMGLMELIVKTGIANAIATLGSLKGNKNAVAETIENNVRRTIIKEHLNDPAFYEKMSALLDEIIAARKAKAIEYEEYLKRIAELAKRVGAGHADDIPDELKRSPALRALYNNLKTSAATNTVGADPALTLAVELDEAIKQARPDGWRDVHARELVIKAAMYHVLKSEEEVERLFPIVKAQREY